MKEEQRSELTARFEKALFETGEVRRAASRAEYAVKRAMEGLAAIEDEPPVEDPETTEEPEIPEEPEVPEEPEPDPEDDEESEVPVGPLPEEAVLPITLEWQQDLYAWLDTLSISDVDLPKAAPTWDGTYHSTSELANLYLGTAVKRVTNPAFPTMVIKGRSEDFVLEGIEEGGKVRYARWCNNGAFWYQLSLPLAGGGEGNPFYRHPALARRALVAAAVDMMMTEKWHGEKGNPWGTDVWAKPDSRFLGGLMTAWAYTFTVCKEVLPTYAQKAFETALAHFAEKLYAQLPGRNTPNMTTRAVSGMAYLYQGASRQETKDLALRTARKYMFGDENASSNLEGRKNALFYHAGYVQEGLSPETTYNGVSLYHLTEARAATLGDPAWDFMDEPLRRMCDFRSHQLYTEQHQSHAKGNVHLVGPSAYAGRTGAGWEKLQASHAWRDMTLAALYTEAHPFAENLTSATAMVSAIKTVFQVNGSMANHFAETGTQRVPEFAIDHDHHWPSYVPYSAGEDWYDVLFARRNDTSFLLPVQRGSHSLIFDEDFWSYRSDGYYACFIETERDGGTYGGYRGGSLQAFYADNYGLVVLGRKNKDSRQWDDIEGWMTHHVWGRHGGRLFSTAVEQKIDVEYGTRAGFPCVTTWCRPNGELQQATPDLTVETLFEAHGTNLMIRHKLTGEADEVFVTLPLYLPDPQFQSHLADPEIRYSENGNGFSLHPALPEGEEVQTNFIWLKRGERFVNVELRGAASVRLGPVWNQSYQANTRLRPLFVRLAASDLEILISYAI